MPKDSRSTYKHPEVAIFGAGISGLTVAHELIERGFKVHVIEPAESATEEYACQVGGMATDQLGRVPLIGPKLAESFSRHDSVASARGTIPPEKIKSDIHTIINERITPALDRLQMEPLQRRFVTTERIRFTKPKSEFKIIDNDLIRQLPQGWITSEDDKNQQAFLSSMDLSSNDKWREFKDEHGITNEKKLRSILTKIHEMYGEYKYQLDRFLGNLLSEPEFCDLSDRKIEEVKTYLLPYMFLVNITGYTDTDGLPEANRKLSEVWAEWVGNALVELNQDQIPHLDRLLIPLGRGTERPLGQQSNSRARKRSNRVEFSIIGQTIPGEHGYRFFPSFYRHLFDTMKRTPVFNEQGELTPETAFDQLVSTPDSAIGLGHNQGVVPVKLRRFTSIKDVQTTLGFLTEKANFTSRDQLRLLSHFIKYMTSCKERRSKESEDNSFWEYIHADRVSYSSSAARFIDSAPQALVAMSAQETDARTQYNTVIQMLVQNPLEPLGPDLTLNDTTSEAWLDRWKKYLKKKGVRFYIGSLEGLELQKAADGRDELIPTVRGPAIHPKRPLPEIDVVLKEEQDAVREGGEEERDEFNVKDSDFFVMALPFERASKIIWKAYRNPAVQKQHTKFCGPFRQLLEFDKVTGRRSQNGDEISRYRDPYTGLPINKSDPLRDISGIQYYLPNTYRFVEGHVYYPESPWALTSISQYAYYRDRVELTGIYIGQQSFDIGDWYERDPTDNGTTAWNSTRQELAERTWAQAITTLELKYATSLVKPKYYHLDDGIKFCVGPELDANKKFMKTISAFRGNAVVRITGVVTDKIYKLSIAGHDIKKPATIEVRAETGDKEEDICRKLVSKINAQKSIAAAILDDPNQIVLSPINTCNDVARIKVKVNGRSAKPAIIFINGTQHTLQKASDKALQNVGNDYVVGREEDGTITVNSKQSPDRHDRGFSVAVCNADNRVELLGGPRLTLELHAPVENGRSLAEIPREVLEYAVVLRNKNPYIINAPGQWRHRPGLDQATGKVDYTIEKELFEECLFRRWVPAGTFMATCTRLTTMEAANESGRHAVNAILQKLMSLPVEEGKEPLFNGQGKLFGDLCKIWDPEDNELADLHSLKELDEALMREDLPHFLDIFRVSEFLEGQPEDLSLEEFSNRIRALINDSAKASFIGAARFDAGVRAYLDAVSALFSGR